MLLCEMRCCFALRVAPLDCDCRLKLTDEMASIVTEKSLLASKKACFCGMTLSIDTGASCSPTGERYQASNETEVCSPVDEPYSPGKPCLESLAQVRGESHVKVSMKREEAHIGPKVSYQLAKFLCLPLEGQFSKKPNGELNQEKIKLGSEERSQLTDYFGVLRKNLN